MPNRIKRASHRFMSLSGNQLGRIGMINSGGESNGALDLVNSAKTAVISRRIGGSGLIVGRKATQRLFDDGVFLLNTVQDVYLSKEIDLA